MMLVIYSIYRMLKRTVRVSVCRQQVVLFLANITATMILSAIVSAVFEVPLLTAEKYIFPSRR